MAPSKRVEQVCSEARRLLSTKDVRLEEATVSALHVDAGIFRIVAAVAFLILYSAVPA